MFRDTPVEVVDRKTIERLAEKPMWVAYDRYPVELRALAADRECGCLLAGPMLGRLEYEECLGRYSLADERGIEV
jgi:hypothetical protein